VTGRDVLSASLRLIGVYASGESPTADEATDGLAALNRMLDSWSTQRLLIYYIPREVFTFTANKGSYTMGSGGDFNTTRPLKLENVELILNDVSPSIERPIQIATKDEYAAIISKSLTSTIPLLVYSDENYPLPTLNFYPVPNTAYQVAIYSWKQLTNVATLDTALSFPPGYERALIYNLALEISPEYGKNPSEVVVQTAMEAKGNIKRLNADTAQFLRCDSALQSRPSRFNIYTGEFR